MSTASDIVNYRNALIKGGIPEDSATEMARDASARIIQYDGLKVDPEPTP